jgi:hypothetical protein
MRKTRKREQAIGHSLVVVQKSWHVLPPGQFPADRRTRCLDYTAEILLDAMLKTVILKAHHTEMLELL